MDAAFPLCMATENLWRKRDASLESPLEVVIRLPMADTCIRSFPAEHNAPLFRMRLGRNDMHPRARRISSTSCLRPPRLPTLVCGFFRLRYEGAKVSATVRSHASALPDFQGTIVRPSGSFRLRLKRSHGSFY